MNLFLTMVAAMYRILKDIAAPRTQRYFLSGVERELCSVGGQKSDEAKQYPVLICDVVRTFCAVMTKQAKSSMVDADDERYPVADYQFPKNWWELAKARKVYASRGAIEYAVPYFRYTGVEGKVLSPLQVLRFFDTYNATQPDSDKIELAGVPESFNNFEYLMSFKSLCCGEMMADWNSDGGTLEDYVAQLLQIEAPLTPDCLRKWEKYDERSVDKWLMSVD